MFKGKYYMALLTRIIKIICAKNLKKYV